MKCMKIILVSDSHGKDEILVKIRNKHQNADLFLHAGDIELAESEVEGYLVVAGNNDFYYDYPIQRNIMTPYGKLVLLHSHTISSYHHSEKLLEFGKEQLARIVCFGHTHRNTLINKEGIYLINPGSLYYNRDGSPLGYYVLDISEDAVHATFIEI